MKHPQNLIDLELEESEHQVEEALQGLANESQTEIKTTNHTEAKIESAKNIAKSILLAELLELGFVSAECYREIEGDAYADLIRLTDLLDFTCVLEVDYSRMVTSDGVVNLVKVGVMAKEMEIEFEKITKPHSFY